MSSHLTAHVASTYQHDLRRAADSARLVSGGPRRESLFQRAIARLQADAGSTASLRRTYRLAPTDR
jgi:hypothetical protein